MHENAEFYTAKPSMQASCTHNSQTTVQSLLTWADKITF